MQEASRNVESDNANNSSQQGQMVTMHVRQQVQYSSSMWIAYKYTHFALHDNPEKSIM